MSETEILENDWPDNVMPCSKCSKAPASNCGYLVHDEWNGDYDCDAPDLEDVNPSSLCEDCPYAWCTECKEKHGLEVE